MFVIQYLLERLIAKLMNRETNWHSIFIFTIIGIILYMFIKQF